MKNTKLKMLSSEQKEIIGQIYSDKMWGVLDAANAAGDMTVSDLRDKTSNFMYDLDRQIMMTIAFLEVRIDSAKQDKTIKKRK